MKANYYSVMMFFKWVALFLLITNIILFIISFSKSWFLFIFGLILVLFSLFNLLYVTKNENNKVL